MLECEHAFLPVRSNIESALKQRGEARVDRDLSLFVPRMPLGLRRPHAQSHPFPVHIGPGQPVRLTGRSQAGVSCQSEQELPLAIRGCINDRRDLIGFDVPPVGRWCWPRLDGVERIPADQVPLLRRREQSAGVSRMGSGGGDRHGAAQFSEPPGGLVGRNRAEWAVLAKGLNQEGSGSPEFADGLWFQISASSIKVSIEKRTEAIARPMRNKPHPCQPIGKLIRKTGYPTGSLIVGGSPHERSVHQLLDPVPERLRTPLRHRTESNRSPHTVTIHEEDPPFAAGVICE